MGRYITTADLLAYAGDDAADDQWADTAVNAAEDWIDKYCGRRFTVATAATTATVRKFPVPVVSTLLPIDDCFSVSSITLSGSAITLASCELVPINSIDAAGETWPFTGIIYSNGWTPDATLMYPVSVTAKWGWPTTIPSSVIQAALILGRDDLLMRRSLGNGYVGATDQFGLRASENRAVTSMLQKYRKASTWGIA